MSHFPTSVRELLTSLETAAARGQTQKCLHLAHQLRDALLCATHAIDPVHFCAACRGGRGGKVRSPQKTAAARQNAKRPRPRETRQDSDGSSIP